MRRLLALWVLFLLTSAANALPEMLIVQRWMPEKDDMDPNFAVGHVIAGELHQQGRVVPIVWSMTDPIFRASVDSGKVKSIEHPTEAQAKEGQRALRVEYMLWVTAVKQSGALKAEAKLFRAGSNRPVWEDTKDLTVTVNDLPDWDSNASTLARTWSAMLGEGPLRGHAPQAPIETPDVNPGANSVPTEAERAPAPKPAQPDPKAIENAEALVAKGLPVEGILLLREACDRSPMDVDLRKALVMMLDRTGEHEMAALEARRAALLVPNGNEFRLLAARSWLALGRTNEAQADLNEALAHAANSPETDVLRGDLMLARGEAQQAIAAYTQAIGKKESFDARFGRALAKGLSGDSRGAKEDFGALPIVPASTVHTAYLRAIDTIDARTEALANAVRDAIALAAALPRSASAIESAENALAAAEGLSAIADGSPVPGQFAASHARRKLAHKLLVQSAQECVLFARNADDENSGESTISLGEALKQLAQARDEFRQESTGR